LRRNCAKDKYKVKIGTWNVGTLTSRSRELVEVLKRRKVNDCCVQKKKVEGVVDKKIEQ